MEEKMLIKKTSVGRRVLYFDTQGRLREDAVGYVPYAELNNMTLSQYYEYDDACIREELDRVAKHKLDL